MTPSRSRHHKRHSMHDGPPTTLAALLLLALLILAGCSSATPTPSPTALPATALPATVAPATVAPATEPPPTAAPTAQPTTAPTAEPTAAPTVVPTAEPTTEPTVALPTSTPAPTATPSPLPTNTPSGFDPARTPLKLETVIEGLTRPTYLTNAGDGSGRIFVLEKPGRIRIFRNGALIAQPFLDITDRVGSTSNEQGLLGMAFSPSFASNGRFYVNYTNADGDTVISRFTLGGQANQADPASETIVLTIDQPAPNHNGGMITFGPDGMLWIGMGDGGGQGDTYHNGQNPDTLLGKILRIDVESATPYTIPEDNPWVSKTWNGADVRDEVWALGLRNPWRFSFDPENGDLWIADVGQNQFEEVNLTLAGSLGGFNFGWPIMEGLHCYQSTTCDQTGLVLPVAEYPHTGNCSITGGYVYRGAQWPALAGVYFYADYCSGTMWALTPSASGGWQAQVALQTGKNVTSFGEDEAGELYVLDDAGMVSRIALSQ